MWTFWESDAAAAGEAAERAAQETRIIKAGPPPAATGERPMPTVDRPGYAELARQERAERAAEYAEEAALGALAYNLPAFMEEAIVDLRAMCRDDARIVSPADTDTSDCLRGDAVERAMLAWLAARLDVLAVPGYPGALAFVVQYLHSTGQWLTLSVNRLASDAVDVFNQQLNVNVVRLCTLRAGELRILHQSTWRRPGSEPLTLQAVAAAGRGTPA